MSQRRNERRHEPADALAAWIRQHPELWEDAVEPLDPQYLDELTDNARERARRLSEQAAQTGSPRLRRRRWIVGVSLSALLVAGGGVGVAAIFRGGQPSKPELGVLCQDRLGEGRNMIALPATDNPIGDCAALWRDGRFAKTGDAVVNIPELVACISVDGAVIQVQPLPLGTCSELGLRPADEQLDARSKQLVAFVDRISSEVNLPQPCLGASTAEARAQQVVDHFKLEGWSVEIRPDSVGATCAKAVVIVEQRTVQIAQYQQ